MAAAGPGRDRGQRLTAPMEIERRTPENTAIVLIDHVVGFANTLGSQSVQDNTNGVLAMVAIAQGYEVPLVVTLGPKLDPRGGLYPAMAEALGNHPLVHRNGCFDSFDDPAFEQAVAETGARHLVIAGLTTEGCVLQTSIGALRRGFEVSLVLDATASLTQVSHDAAVARMTQLGVVPTTWLSFAAELQRTYANADTIAVFRRLQDQHVPGISMLMATVRAAQASVEHA